MVGNAVFSETALRIFLIFCMKLRDYKSGKVTELDFWKKFLIWRYLWKGLQISPKSDTLIFFSKTALTVFLVFGLFFLVFGLNIMLNLNETDFFRKICNLEIFDLGIVKTLPKLSFFYHFLNFASFVFFDFAYNDRWAWCLLIFLQFASPVNVFLFFQDIWGECKHLKKFFF